MGSERDRDRKKKKRKHSSSSSEDRGSSQESDYSEKQHKKKKSKKNQEKQRERSRSSSVESKKKQSSSAQQSSKTQQSQQQQQQQTQLGNFGMGGMGLPNMGMGIPGLQGMGGMSGMPNMGMMGMPGQGQGGFGFFNMPGQINPMNMMKGMKGGMMPMMQMPGQMPGMGMPGMPGMGGMNFQDMMMGQHGMMPGMPGMMGMPGNFNLLTQRKPMNFQQQIKPQIPLKPQTGAVLPPPAQQTQPAPIQTRVTAQDPQIQTQLQLPPPIIEKIVEKDYTEPDHFSVFRNKYIAPIISEYLSNTDINIEAAGAKNLLILCQKNLKELENKCKVDGNLKVYKQVQEYLTSLESEIWKEISEKTPKEKEQTFNINTCLEGHILGLVHSEASWEQVVQQTDINSASEIIKLPVQNMTQYKNEAQATEDSNSEEDGLFEQVLGLINAQKQEVIEKIEMAN